MSLPVPGLEFLAHVVVELDEPVDLGGTDAGHRRIAGDRRRNGRGGAVYFRVHATFETSAPQHAWLTRALTIGVARRRASAVVYDAYPVT